MAVPVVSPAGIEGLRESAELLTRELKTSQAVKEVLFNLKGWEGGRARLVEDLLSSGHRLARGAGVRGIVEEPGTLEGSACAVVNVCASRHASCISVHVCCPSRDIFALL